jgi:hypothetical protein
LPFNAQHARRAPTKRPSTPAGEEGLEHPLARMEPKVATGRFRPGLDGPIGRDEQGVWQPWGCVPASWSLCRADIRNATVLAVPFRRRRFVPRRRLHSLLALKLTSAKPGTGQHPSVSAKTSSCFECLRSPRTVAVLAASCNPKVCRLREALIPRSSAFVVRWCLHFSPSLFARQLFVALFPKDYFHPVRVSLGPPSLDPNVRHGPEASVSRCSAFDARWCLHLSPPFLHVSCSLLVLPFFPFPFVSPMSTATVSTYPPDRDRAKNPSRDFGRC